MLTGWRGFGIAGIWIGMALMISSFTLGMQIAVLACASILSAILAVE